jgi:hypothetical protein
MMKSTITFVGLLTRAVLMAVAVFVPTLALFSGASPAPKVGPRSGGAERHCVPIGGTVMTNFGAIDPLTNTLGPASGGLRGAVSATLLGAPQPGTGGTLRFMSSIIGSRNRAIRSPSIRRWRRPLRSRKPFSRSSPIPSTLQVARASSPERPGTSRTSVKWFWARRRRCSATAARSVSRNKTSDNAGAGLSSRLRTP